MRQAPPDHFDDIGRTGHVDPEIALIEIMHDLLQSCDGFPSLLPFNEHDEVARLSVRRDQQPFPKRTGQRIVEVLWPGGQAFDRANRIDRLDLARQLADSREITRRRNIARRDRQDQLRRGWKLPINLV
jgi:hypothetical protein